jgi:hypothetical protein
VTDLWQRLTLHSPANYSVRVGGQLSPSWSPYLGGMRIENGNGDTFTLLVGALADQAALMGVLKALIDMGYPILSVECIGSAGSEAGG